MNYMDEIDDVGVKSDVVSCTDVGYPPRSLPLLFVARFVWNVGKDLLCTKY